MMEPSYINQEVPFFDWELVLCCRPYRNTILFYRNNYKYKLGIQSDTDKLSCVP